VLAETYAKPVADVLRSRGAKLVVLDAGAQSRLLAGQVAAHLGVSPVSAVEITPGEPLVVARMVFGGLAMATEQITSEVAVLVVGPGTLPASQEPGAGGAEIITVEPSPGATLLETRAKGGQTVDLAAAKRVVGVGRGFASAEDLELARALAAKLGAEMACSRPIAEGVNWMPTERYLGCRGHDQARPVPRHRYLGPGAAPRGGQQRQGDRRGQQGQECADLRPRRLRRGRRPVPGAARAGQEPLAESGGKGI